MSANPTETDSPKSGKPPVKAADIPLPALMVRSILGGALMGFGNLAPGISGGTMLLAAGIFPAFVEAVADLTCLRFNKRSLLLLATVGISAALVIASLAGPIGRLIVEHTWIMYSIAIGLTLGGGPLIWRMVGRKTPVFWTGATVGLAAMILVAYLQMSGTNSGGAANEGFFLMFIAGILGATAMVLPGLNGGYFLLLLGVYVPVLQGIDAAFIAARSFDISALIPPVTQIILPVGLGVGVGVAGVSNLIKAVLDRFPNITLGILLGILVGAVAGLWPFQHGVEPEAGTVLQGQTIEHVEGVPVYAETSEPVAPADFPQEYFRPTAGQSVGAALMIIAGFVVTAAAARFGGEE